MCTVTFIPAKDGYYITSNRDEKISRKPAIPPREYLIHGKTMIFPKDADGGGTWIALNCIGNAGVLLNGAFKKHIPALMYRRSRGLILLEIMASDDPIKQFLELNLMKIEPFTLITLNQGGLFELLWDGGFGYP
ncbi:MAG TPA: NRDE family protein [Puia sp.]